MRIFNDYCGDDRTGYAKLFAKEHGMTQRTLYRMSESYLTASAWALKYERITGLNYDFLQGAGALPQAQGEQHLSLTG